MQSAQTDSSLALAIVVPIFSGVVGSLATLIGNHFYTQWREKKQKREQIFRTLMSTRGFRTYATHVEALCAVEVEWSSPEDEKVRSAWKAYNHHLNKQVSQDLSDPENVAWRNTLEDLFADLIVALGESIGKPQDKTDVKTGAYGPRAWWEAEQENSVLRKGMVRIIASGLGRAIPVLVQYDGTAAQQVSSSPHKSTSVSTTGT